MLANSACQLERHRPSPRVVTAVTHIVKSVPRPPLTLAVLTISDLASRGERADTSGDAIVAWAATIGAEVTARAVVSDDVPPIVSRLTDWCDNDVADLVITTGGTGFAERDVTPEATRIVIERDAPGIAELLRITSAAKFPRAALSRGLSGIRNRTLIVNLPGSPRGVNDGLAVLETFVAHGVAILRGEVTEHSPRGSSPRVTQPGAGRSTPPGSRLPSTGSSA